MTEVYIQGIGRCKNKIRKALSKSHLVEGDHYIEGINSLHEHHHTLLYWKTNNTRLSLREFKEAIGPDLIWEHRLRFYENVDDLPKAEITSNEVTEEEMHLIEEYRL